MYIWIFHSVRNKPSLVKIWTQPSLKWPIPRPEINHPNNMQEQMTLVVWDWKSRPHFTPTKLLLRTIEPNHIKSQQFYVRKSIIDVNACATMCWKKVKSNVFLRSSLFLCHTIMIHPNSNVPTLDYLERCSNNKKQTLSSLKVNCKGTVAQMMSIVKLLFWYEKCAEKWWFTVRFFFLQVTTSKKNSPIRFQTSLSQFSKNKLLVFVFKLLLVFGCLNEAFSTTFRSGLSNSESLCWSHFHDRMLLIFFLKKWIGGT